MGYKIAFSAGEFSGDEHLSNLLCELKLLIPDSQFRGLAGPKTRALGIETELAIEDYASVMGFVDVAKAAPRIIRALNCFKKLFQTWKPNLLIIVDYPDFNLKLAKLAKDSGAKVLYYIPPKLWAWRQSRIKLIQKYVDCTALIFPFEKEFYQNLGYNRSHYVGHPFYNSLKKEDCAKTEQSLRMKFIESYNLDPQKPVLAFFPGSRSSEIKRHWSGMVAGLEELLKRVPETQILLSVAPPVKALVQEYLKNISIKCTIIESKNLEILRFSDLGFVKSGTSNLQAAFYELPFVMYYQASRFSELIVRTFVKIKEFSLVNIIRPGTVKELLQKEASPQRIAEELELLISNSVERQKVKAGLREVHERLGSFDSLEVFKDCQTAAQRTARLAINLLEAHR